MLLCRIRFCSIFVVSSWRGSSHASESRWWTLERRQNLKHDNKPISSKCWPCYFFTSPSSHYDETLMQLPHQFALVSHQDKILKNNFFFRIARTEAVWISRYFFFFTHKVSVSAHWRIVCWSFLNDLVKARVYIRSQKKKPHINTHVVCSQGMETCAVEWRRVQFSVRDRGFSLVGWTLHVVEGSYSGAENSLS